MTVPSNSLFEFNLSCKRVGSHFHAGCVNSSKCTLRILRDDDSVEKIHLNREWKKELFDSSLIPFLNLICLVREWAAIFTQDA